MTIDTTNFSFPDVVGVYKGKVRDVYEFDEKVVLIATDRISCFDRVLPRAIPHKGAVLNQIAAHFLTATKDIVPNWLESVLHANVSMGVKAVPIRAEVIVRGVLMGSAWRAYATGIHTVCGVELPEGLKEFSKFETPIITPTTKEEAGHDQDISSAELVASGVVTQDEWDQVSKYALDLFQKGQDMAQERGLLLADTKYEFGKTPDGTIILMDEIHTPDSSRYLYLDAYDNFVAGRTIERPVQLSKEFVREWLVEQGFTGEEGQDPPAMSDSFVEDVSRRYQELYEILIGTPFANESYDSIMEHIEQAITNELEH